MIHSLYLLKTLFLEFADSTPPFDASTTVPRDGPLARRRFLVLFLYRYRIVKEHPIKRIRSR